MKRQISTNKMNGIYCSGTLSSMNVDVLFTINDIVELVLPEKIGFSMRFTDGISNFVAKTEKCFDFAPEYIDKCVNIYVL